LKKVSGKKGNNLKDWQKQAKALHDTGTMSWREIASKLEIPRSTVSDYLRKLSVQQEYVIPVQPFCTKSYEARKDNSCVLIISDMHIPYHHPRLIEFLTEIKKKYKPTRVIGVGDELDKHSLSFHDSDPDLFGAGHELEAAKETIKQIHKLFPEMDLVDSNHGSMIYRKAKHHGIPRSYIRSYNEVLGVGDGWKWHHDLTIILPDGQPCYIHHGKSADGLRLSQAMGMSCVQGHFHEKFGISYWANPLGLYFSMQVGCLIDDDSYAFAYNNVNIKRPIIGLGLIVDGIPVLEAMKL
jgi:hypothetical protein